MEGARPIRCALAADRCQIASRRAWEASRPRRAGMVCVMMRRLAWIHDRGALLHPYIPYYNRRLPCPVQCPAWRLYLVAVEVQRLAVCPPTWHRRRYIRFCLSGIVGGRTGQVAGKAPVKPCALFCDVGCIVLHGRNKTRCKRLCVADTPPGKIKALHRVDARQKKSPAISDRAKCFLFGRLKQRRKKPEEEQDTRKYHLCAPPHARPRHVLPV